MAVTTGHIAMTMLLVDELSIACPELNASKYSAKPLAPAVKNHFMPLYLLESIGYLCSVYRVIHREVHFGDITALLRWRRILTLIIFSS